MKHLIVGYGEVGKALHKVLGEAMTVDLGDTSGRRVKVDVVHICIPYSKSFEETVKEYKKWGKLVIVHSSVPVGTCGKLRVVHSPIRGVHPNLAEGIKTFYKYFGGADALKAGQIFADLGVKVRCYKKAKITEAMKLWDTTQYGRLIMLEKEIYEWCKQNHLPFEEVYTRANQDYNEGYMALGRPEVVRPYLKHVPGPIGGHCVVPNAKLLKKNL